MIIVTELAFSDGGHAPFNAGLLSVIQIAFPEEHLCFVGAPQHIEELKKQVGASSASLIEWKEITILPPSFSYFSRLFHEAKMLKMLLGNFPEGATRLLLLTSVRPATLMALKLVKCFQFKDIRVQIILHGNLTGVMGKRYRHPIRRIQEMRTALTIFGNSNLQYLVLEENFRDVLLHSLPVLSGKVEMLDHPLPPNEADSKILHWSTPVRFGFLGLVNEAKGFPVFLELAKNIVGRYPDQTEFHAIGRLSLEGNLPSSSTDVLTTKPGVKRLSRMDYIQGVGQLHFIVFPHLASSYELNSSGTLLDALAWGKPLIARKIAIFENFFAKHGNIGYLFSSDKELREIVEHIIEGADKESYDEQVHNIQKAQSSRSPEALGVDYRNISANIVRQVSATGDM